MTSASASAVKRAAGALVAGALITTPSMTLRAEEAPVDLTWHAPPGCPERAVVLGKVQQLLGASSHSRSPLKAEGSVVRRPNGYALELVLKDGEEKGERVLFARRCEDLAGAAAVTLALLYSGSDTAGNTQEASSGGARAAEATANPKTGAQTAESARADAAREESRESAPERAPKPATKSAPRDLAILLDAPLGALRFGPLPSPAFGAGAGVGIMTNRWSLRLLAQLFQTETLSVDGLPAYGTEARLASAELLGCRDLRSGNFGVSGCLELGVAYLRARGYGRFIVPVARDVFWPVLGVGALGRWEPLDWFAVILGVSGQVHLARPHLTLGEVFQVRELAPTSATLFVTPEWIF